MTIKTVLSNLYTAQRTLIQAESAADVARIISDTLCAVVVDSTVEVMLGSQSLTGEFASLTLDALKTREPRLGMKGHHLVVPMGVESEVLGLISIQSQHPL